MLVALIVLLVLLPCFLCHNLLKINSTLFYQKAYLELNLMQSVLFFSMFPQLLGDTCYVFSKETNQLQPPHQSQQSLLHFSRDRWNQPDPLYRLREWPTSILAIGASQRGPGQHEQCSRGLCYVIPKSRSTSRMQQLDFCNTEWLAFLCTLEVYSHWSWKSQIIVKHQVLRCIDVVRINGHQSQ